MARTPNQAVDTQVAILAGKGIPKMQIARTLGIGKQRVRHALQRQAETIEQAEHALREYQGELTQVIPNDRKAARLKQLVEDVGEPMASMRAIEHIDKVMGFLRPASESSSQHQPVSLFQLPEGAVIGIAIKPKD